MNTDDMSDDGEIDLIFTVHYNILSLFPLPEIPDVCGDLSVFSHSFFLIYILV